MDAHFDVIIVGGGHAGCEAAMALARLGHKSLLISSNVDHIGNVSCNPAIGGLAKGHMVREIDALGGMMGLWADQAGIQFRTLNTGKGPAVRATRAQIDRVAYRQAVQRSVFSQPNLYVWHDMVDKLLSAGGRTEGVATSFGRTFYAPHVLLTTGTFLRGLIHIGLTQIPGGRLGDAPADKLSLSLMEHGLTLGRLKTGTTPRIHKASINFSRLEPQYSDQPLPRFSFHGPGPQQKQVACHITWTNARTHEIIMGGLDRSPMFSGVIKGIGARYCPSIEDKVFRFAERERHQIFIEPEGLASQECYPNGISTSLPLDVQIALIRSIEGLEKAEIVRPGYAIEYDYVNPVQLKATFESKALPGLWLAGQINGTSGYEEAAAQGLWAGINIHQALKGEAPWLPGRHEAYMAVLADDLVTLGTNEPYRMFTSRAEHRLLLREHNADTRLCPQGRALGLVGDAQWQRFENKHKAMRETEHLLHTTRVGVGPESEAVLAACGEKALSQAASLAELLRRPAVSLSAFAPLFPWLDGLEAEVAQEVETVTKYVGYLERQQELVRRSQAAANTALPPDLPYGEVHGLSAEIVEKLKKIQPATLGQAGRISGVTPAAVTCLEIWLKKHGLR